MGTGDRGGRLRAVLVTIVLACAAIALAPTAYAQAATFTADSPAAVEGNPGSGGQAVFTVTLSEPAGNATSVNVQTSAQTASAALDFIALPSTLVTFAPGETTKQVAVTLVGDQIDEVDETFTLQLTAPTGGPSVPLDAHGTATILDDDDPPTVDITGASITEPTTGTALINFNVLLARASAKTVTVRWATQDGTAVAPGDYTQATGQITFAPGAVSKNITVQVQSDAVHEPDETFTVELMNPDPPTVMNATIGDGTAVGTITEPPATFSASSPAGVLEGNPGSGGQVVFDVVLSKPVGNATSVNVHTSAQTAISGLDFIALPSTPVTFAPGETTKQVAVTLVGDQIDEVDEAFTLQLTAPTGGPSVPLTAFGTATILDDDLPPTVGIEDASVTEQSNATSLIAFRVSLERASGKTVTVRWATQDGTAQAPADYTQTTNQIVFSPGTVSQNITVQIVGDTIDEANETFSVVLSDPNPPTVMNATIGDGTAVGTIRDDDGPSITITGATVVEGAAGTEQIARLTVALNAISPQDVSVAYLTVAGTAKAPDDYTEIPAGQRLTIPSGQLIGTISVVVKGDDIDEADEAFSVNLSAPDGGNLTAATGAVTITDDDSSPTVTTADVSVAEGTGGSAAANVVVTLSAVSTRKLTATYTSSDGTARAGVDYAAQNGTLTFEAGEVSKTISVPIGTDDEIEDNETFAITIADTTPGGATVTSTVTILDDDLTAALTPSLRISDGTPVPEGDTGTRTATFVVRLDKQFTRTVTARYATAPGTATSPADFAATSGEVRFAPGETVQTIEIPVHGDKVPESNHAFAVKLTEPVNARLDRSSAVGIIVDDDVGLERVDVAAKTVGAASVLCRRTGASACRGLGVGWRTIVPGTIRVDIDAFLPVRKVTGSQAKAEGKATKRQLRLLRRTIRVKSGTGRVNVRRTGGSAQRLLRRIRAARVKSVRVSVSFTNRQGARQTQRFTVRLR